MKIIETLKRNYFIYLTMFFSLVLVITSFLNAVYQLKNITQPLIINFSDGKINKVGNLGNIWVLGIFSLLILPIDFFLAVYLDKREKFLSKMLASAALFLAVLIFILFSVIVSVNL